jgi:beta-lactamase regulating signal transducer with metallopeptidase domain
MTVSELSAHPDVQALGWALIHFLWQGAVAAALLFYLNLLTRRESPTLRYLLACATLLVMVSLPVINFLASRDAGAAAVEPLLAPAQTESPALAGAQAGLARPSGHGLRRWLSAALPWLVGAWFLGVLVLSLRYLGGWAVVQRLKRSGTRAEACQRIVDRLCRELRVSRAVRVCESALVEVPTVIGWLKPVILIPASALVGLAPAQVEALLAHELAHVRRLDYLVNLLQTAAETLLFYHPAVWWVSHRMRMEREHCCDDAAVLICGDAARYARALADLESLRLGAPAFAVAATGGSLPLRIARLLGERPSHLLASSRWPAGLVALAALTASGLAASMEGAAPESTSASMLVAGPGHPAAEARPALRAAAAPEAEPAEEATPAARSEPLPEPRPESDPGAEPQGDPQAKPQAPSRSSKEPSIDELIEMLNHGVTPEFVDEMSSLGYSLSPSQLIELRSQGVNPRFVRELTEAGQKNLAPDDLLRLRSQGVTASFVREMSAVGLGSLSLDHLVELRSHGVTPQFAREMKGLGYDLSVSELVALRSQGVTPEFVREMTRSGKERLSVTKLVSLRSHGVSASYVDKLRSLGYDDVSSSKLVALRSNGVSADYVEKLVALGYSGLSVPTLIGLRSHGVTPEFIGGMKEAGYDRLDVAVLMQLRSHGVTPEYVRGLREAGFDKLAPEELIDLRSRGVSVELLRRLKGRLSSGQRE